MADKKVPVNPASKLYDRLTAWAVTPRGTSVRDFRGGDKWVELHVEAVGWARAVESFLLSRDVVRNADKKLIGAIWGAIFLPQTMPISDRRLAIEERWLDMLSMVAEAWPSAPQISPDALNELSELIGEVKESIIGATSIGDDVRRYFLTIVSNLEQAISDVKAFGTANVTELALQLEGVLLRLFIGEPEQHKQRVSDLLERVVKCVGLFVANVSAGALGGAAGNAITAALTMGG
jgi:hypothetical protein